MEVGKFMLGVCQTNCYFLNKEDSKEVIVVDPADRGDLLYQKLTEAGYEIKAILLTHGHFDHILGADEMRKLASVKIYALDVERQICENSGANLSDQFGKACTISVDVYVKDGDVIEAAGMKAKVIATPGHTIGSCCYYFEEDKVLISGDTLFEESVGRSDFPTGSHSQLVHSIEDRLMVLEDDVDVFPGHGDQTTIGHERKYNPFLM